MDICPFCHNDPYEWVDIGVGREAVAVNCCEEGYAYFVLNMSETEIRNCANSTFFLYDLQHVGKPYIAEILDSDCVVPF